MLDITLINECTELELSIADMEYLNSNEMNITFSQVPCYTLIPRDALLVLIEISQNIGLNATYDVLKYSLRLIFNFVQKKLPRKERPTEIRVKSGKKEFICSLSFELTDEQKDKLVETVIDKLTQL